MTWHAGLPTMVGTALLRRYITILVSNGSPNATRQSSSGGFSFWRKSISRWWQNRFVGCMYVNQDSSNKINSLEEKTHTREIQDIDGDQIWPASATPVVISVMNWTIWRKTKNSIGGRSIAVVVVQQANHLWIDWIAVSEFRIDHGFRVLFGDREVRNDPPWLFPLWGVNFAVVEFR